MAFFFRKFKYQQQRSATFIDNYNEYKRVINIAQEDKKKGNKEDCLKAITVGVELLDNIIEFECNLERTKKVLKKANIKNVQEAIHIKEELNEQA